MKLSAIMKIYSCNRTNRHWFDVDETKTYTRRKNHSGSHIIHVQYSTFLTFLGCWFVLASHATYWQLKTCWSMKHRNHINVNNYRLDTISSFLTYVYLVRTPLIRLLLKAMYLYYIIIVGRDILPIATYL
jgi:hypothetical protein